MPRPAGSPRCCSSAAADQVVAVDVGTGQLAEPLRSDPRVLLFEQTNLRQLTLTHVDQQPVDLVVADVSFISLTLLLRPLTASPRRRGPCSCWSSRSSRSAGSGWDRAAWSAAANLRRAPWTAWPPPRRTSAGRRKPSVPSRVAGASGNQEYLRCCSGRHTRPFYAGPVTDPAAARNGRTRRAGWRCSPTPAARRPSARPTGWSKGSARPASSSVFPPEDLLGDRPAARRHGRPAGEAGPSRRRHRADGGARW